MTTDERAWIFSPHEPPGVTAVAQGARGIYPERVRALDVRSLLWCMAYMRSVGAASSGRLLNVHESLLTPAVQSVASVTASPLPGRRISGAFFQIVVARHTGGTLPKEDLSSLLADAQRVDPLPVDANAGGLSRGDVGEHGLTGAIGPMALVTGLYHFASLVAWSRRAPATFDMGSPVGFELRTSSLHMVDSVRLATELTRSTWNADSAALLALYAWGSAPLLPGCTR